jgi:hypothetical protein
VLRLKQVVAIYDKTNNVCKMISDVLTEISWLEIGLHYDVLRISNFEDVVE